MRGTASWPPCTTTAVGLLERLDLDRCCTRSWTAPAARRHASTRICTSPIETADLAAAVQVGLGIFEPYVGPHGRGQGLPAKSVTGETVVVDDYSVWPDRRPEYRRARFHAVAGVPLRAGGQGRRRDRHHPPRAAAVRSRGSRAARAVRAARVACARERAALQRSAAERRAAPPDRRLLDRPDQRRRPRGDDRRHLALGSTERSESSRRRWSGRYFAGLVHPDDMGAAQEMFSKAVQGTLADHDRPCPPRRRQLGPARRNRQRDRRPGRRTAAHPRDRPRRDRAASASRSSCARRRRWKRSAGWPAASRTTSTTC